MSNRHRGHQHDWEIRIGHRQVFGRGFQRRFWGDLFHQCMAMSWARLALWYAAYMLTVNLLFAILFWLVPGSVTGPRSPNFGEVFFFAFEVFGTVSFGGFLPGNLYGHAVAMAEIIVGIASFAVMTGLSFARFTRPRAHVLFARHPLMTQREGQWVFCLRVANSRHNFLSDAQAKLWYVANVGEGAERTRRFQRLTLERDDSPLFALSWTLFHQVDADSPLFGETPESLAARRAGFAVVISGHDETYGQEVRARHYYEHDDLRWHHRYTDIFSIHDDGVEHVDFGRFHEVEPLARED